ncbi:hypothetical protein [Aestuariibacter sp. A3R04]|uniref:hypothetical protein n=1 Tax=Aestuariibacter sp. A3R04 TaxID=2841571 RepID=UPI001C0A664A|nr:hypothetical protein [Aestuariibacter sp. A3R04]MBU3022862.1 hypothetical protein [Aestuariibacter sp. A3R04]
MIQNVNYILSSPKIEVLSAQLPEEVSDMTADIRLYGLSEIAITTMSSMQTTSEDHALLMMEFLDELGKSSPGVAIKDISVLYNSVPTTIHGDMAFLAFSSQDIESGEIAGKANVGLNVSIGKEVDTALPQFAPMLKHYMQAGFVIKDEEQNYISDITVKDRSLSANDNTIQQC